jgi:hypothetical protein
MELSIMKQLLVSLFVTPMLTCTSIAAAYEITTHQKLSEAAVSASILQTDSTVLPNLGLQPLSDQQQQFLNSRGTKGTISALFQEGASFEDDSPRFVHHFYDPTRDLPLTDIPGPDFVIPTPQKSPDWALEDNETFGSEQTSSFRDARLYFYNALTWPTKHVRDSSFGFTFQTLGQVIHHLQDMAQPQHVRNEAHPFHPESLYEHYTKEVQDSIFFFGYEPVFSPEGNHATFNTPRKLWVGDGKGIAEFTNRNFVSYGHNFTLAPGSDSTQPLEVSHIRPHPDYPAPNGEGAQLLVENVHIVPQVAIDPIPPALTGKVYYIGTPVSDEYRPDQSGFNHWASTFSIYDVDLQKFHLTVPSCTGIPAPCQTEAVFSVNRATMRAAHTFLIPRAVAYSAGLINYFFRGKIDFEPDSDPQNPNGYLIKNLGTEDMNGTFTLYYDDAEGNRHPVLKDAQGQAQGWPMIEPLPPQGTLSVPAFDRPTDPPPKDSKSYMLVFTGTMGHEAPVNGSVGAVVGKQVTIDRPGFLIVTEFSTYKSRDLDQDWERIGDGGLHIASGFAVSEGRLLANGASLSSATLGILQSLDGGATFTDMMPAFLDPTTVRFFDVTYLGENAMLLQSSSFETSISFIQYATAYSPDLGMTWDVQSYFHYGDPPYNTFEPEGFPAYVGNGMLLLNAAQYNPNYNETPYIPWYTGLFQSTDQGRSWSATSFTVDGYALSGCSHRYDIDTWGSEECTSMGGFDLIVWNQVEGEDSVLLASGQLHVYRRGAGPLQVLCGPWKSTDGGHTWRTVPLRSGDPVQSRELCKRGTISSAIAPDGRALMAVLDYDLQNYSYSFIAYKSTDAGDTWEPFTAPDGNPVLGVMYLGNHLDSE